MKPPSPAKTAPRNVMSAPLPAYARRTLRSRPPAPEPPTRTRTLTVPDDQAIR